MNFSAEKYVIKTVKRAFIIVTFNVLLLGCTAIEKNAQQRTGPIPSPTVASSVNDDQVKESFYMEMMNIPFYPANTTHRNIACDMPVVQSEWHKTSDEIVYSLKEWEQRIPLDTETFKGTEELGRILLIDTVYTEAGPAYRYFSNDTHNQVYEPWSSSKVFAYTGALAKMREKGVGAPAVIGESNVSDMITTIHSYEAFGTSESSSNEVATYFANIAGRQYLTSLFFDEWLKLSNNDIFFRGAYGPSPFNPNSDIWIDEVTGTSVSINAYQAAQDDPAYLPYRCDTCGLTGNKAMTTLAQAEWLKRLAMHERSPQTAHPNLTSDDIQSLFYGMGNSLGNDTMAGMTQGISNMLHRAIANQIDTTKSPSNALDDYSNGAWRIFQKIGWGPSETRGTTEGVVLAHVCLPNAEIPSQSMQFTVAAQVSVDHNAEANLPLAGKKILKLLNTSIKQYVGFKGAN